ncbi:MAG: YdcF family protein [Lachnospiraceae bacterium]|nr:YdcF family protein [Lachnospiraceae bacterium]
MERLWYGKGKWLKRIILLAVAAGILGILAILGMNGYIKASVADSIYTEEEVEAVPQVDCIMVLGAGVKDGEPSLVLRDRLDRGIELYQQGISERILMSGDHGRTGYDEVHIMKQYAMEAGVPEECIFMDHAGFSTYESMYRAKEVFEVKSLAIVTQPYHEYRAVFAAQKLGLTAYGTPSKKTVYQGSWMLEVREMLARAKDFVWLLVKPKPTYLGEKIPISGTGSSTEDETTAQTEEAD